jgi:hypothetical protein
MNRRIVLTIFFTSAVLLTAQSAARRNNSSVEDPCPGGRATAEVDTVGVPTLEAMIRGSQVIADGIVVRVLPAFVNNPQYPGTSIETDSLIALTEIISGTLPPGSQTIALDQMGGKVGGCTVVVPADPLVKEGERYILFLRADDRPVPNTSGFPRYSAIGLWSGKAKVEAGKMQFLPRALPGLHRYDGTDVTSFVATVKDRLAILLRKK